MTEGSESLLDNSAYFDAVWEEDLGLFFPEASEDVSLDTDRRSHPMLRAVVAAGSAAILYVGLLSDLSELSKSPAPQHSATLGRSISLKTLPKKLPLAVKKDLNNVGRVDIEIYPSQDVAATTNNYETEQWGSAVEVTPSLMLTAGHVMSGPSVQLNTSTECRQVTFINPAQRAFLNLEYGTTSVNAVASIPDLEVLSLPQDDVSYYGITRKLEIAPKPPKVGEDLFFVNYEPEPNGMLRYIDYLNTNAAIYGGVYEGKTTYDDYDVITGIRSYGQVASTSSIGGASGGAVFNTKGQLVGLSVRASDNSANNELVSSSSIEEYGHLDNITFTGLKPNRQVTDTIVQPVTKSLISQYVSREHSITQNCFPEGGEQ